MKKAILLFMIGMIAAFSVDAQVQPSKEYRKQSEAYKKAAEKIAKKQAKQLKKEKWEYSGVIPLEMALTNYYLETIADFGGDKKGQEHEINNAQTMSVAESHLLLNAQTAYAQEIQTMLGAELGNSINSEGGNDFEAFVANVAAKTKHEFSGDVRRSLLLKRRNPDGRSFTVRGYFIIDEKAGLLRARQIANQVQKNGEMLDDIHGRVFGE